jgi:hypothetical protein
MRTKNVFAFTHWACFDCRKSFAKEPLIEGARKCPECAKPMTDMGAFFEPPRKLNVKRWAIMKILADHDFRFNTKEAQIFIQNRLLQAKNPRAVDVVERIELERQSKQNDD